MTITGHAVAAHLTVGMHPAIRVVWGIVSHWILDEALHEHRPKGLHVTDPATWTNHAPWLAWQVMGTVLFWLITGDPIAIVYGMLPDILEGLWIAYGKIVQGKDHWMSGTRIAHIRIPWIQARELTASQNITIEAVWLGVLLY